MVEVRQKHIARSIADQERHAISLAKAAEVASKPLPTDAKEVFEAKVILEQALSDIEKVAHNARDPSVRDAAARLRTKLTTQRDELNGPVWSAYVTQMGARDRTGPLSDTELTTLLAVAGKRFSGIEKQVFDQLEEQGLITKDQRQRLYLPARAKSWQRMQADETFKNIINEPRTNLYWQAIKTEIGPTAPSLVLGLFGAKFGLSKVTASAVTYATMALGAEARGHLKPEADANIATRGMNRLELRQQHPLGAVAERAADDELWAEMSANPKNAGELLRREIAVTDGLVKIDNASFGASRANDAFRKRALNAVGEYRATLQRAAGGPQGKLLADVAAARKALKAALNKSLLEQLEKQALVQTTAWTPQDTADVERVMTVQLRSAVLATNPSLGQLVQTLAVKYDVDRRVQGIKAGKRADVGTRLTRAEVDAIRLAAGAEPSLLETMGLISLVRAGVVTMGEIWPNGIKVNDGLDTASLFRGLDELRPGGNAEKAAVAVARTCRYVGAAGSVALQVFTGWTGVGALASVIPAVAGEIGGAYWAEHIRAQGAQDKALSGNLGSRRPLHDPFALIVERWSRPDFLTGSGGQLRERAAREAELVEAMTGQARAMVRTLVDAPWLSDDQRNAVRTAILHLAERIDVFGRELRSVGKEQSLGDAALRERLAVIRAELLADPRVVPTITEGVLATGATELSSPIMPAAAARGVLLGRIARLIQRAEAGEKIEPLYCDLYGEAWDLEHRGYGAAPKALRKKFQRDALDQFAARVLEVGKAQPLKPLSLAELKSLVANAPKMIASWEGANASLALIGREQAGPVAEELVDTYWHFAVPVFAGSVDKIQKPSFRVVTIAPQKANAPAGAPGGGFTVTGVVGSNGVQLSSAKPGSFEVRIGAHGEVESVRVSWDGRTMDQLALAHLRQHLQVLGISPQGAKIESRTGNAEGTSFGVAVGGHRYEVRLHPGGQLHSPVRPLGSGAKP